MVRDHVKHARRSQSRAALRASNRDVRNAWLVRAAGALSLTVLPLLLSCAPESPMAPTQLVAIGDGVAFGVWTPTGTDTCTKAIHDSYSTVGPDSLRYPTWHPPVDPETGCTFGHEHGRDPRGSDLYREVGDIPFAYANQHLMESGFGAVRNEDHVGHKIEWENDVEMRPGEGGVAVISVRCDVMVKMHQGSHSRDAFTNNMHEVAYHIRCSDGTGFSATVLTPIGPAGELTASCDREREIHVGTATPPNSPNGGGHRAIPDVACIQQHVMGGTRPNFDAALHESWEISVGLTTTNGRTLAAFNPYFQVTDPSRYYDPAAPNVTARPIDLCKNALYTNRDRCQGIGADVTWDSPNSPFKGVRRFVDINGNFVGNADGPTVWYTDPLGRRGRTEWFPGAIRQWIASHSNNGLDLHGPVIGQNRSYNGPGVRAPN